MDYPGNAYILHVISTSFHFTQL